MSTISNRPINAKAYGVRIRESRFLLIGYLIGVALTLIVELVGAPPLGGADIYIFKDAGCNSAKGLGFTAFGIPGAMGPQRRLYASYTPVFPFTFGLYAKLLGCNAESNAWFNWTLGIVTTTFLVLLVGSRIVFRPFLGAGLGLLVGLAAPSGLVTMDGDRPEVLALAFFLTTCVVAGSRRFYWHCVAAPLLAGCTFLVHPFAGASAGLVVWCSAMSDPTTVMGKGANWSAIRSAIVNSLVISAWFFAPIGLVASIYRHLDPTAFGRFFSHALGYQPQGGGYTGLGTIAHFGIFHLLRRTLSFEGKFQALGMLAFAASISVIILAAIRSGRLLLNRQYILMFGFVLIVSLGCLCLFPRQSYYMDFARAIFVIVFLLSSELFHIRFDAMTTVVPLMLLCVISVYPFEVRADLMRVQLAQSWRQAGTQVDLLAEVVGQSRDKGVFVVPAAMYMLYKPKFPLLLNIFKTDPAAYITRMKETDRALKVMGIAVCDRLVMPGHENHSVDFYLREPLTMVAQHQVIDIFSLGSVKSTWGWSCDQYLVKKGTSREARSTDNGRPALTSWQRNLTN